MTAATDFFRSLVGWRPSSIGGPIAPGEEEPPAESGAAEPNQVESSAPRMPPVSLAEPVACNAPETPPADDRAFSDGRVEQPASACPRPTSVLSATELAREFDFTERQARFLILVMRHSGVCMLRQYSTFAGIVHGQKTRKFFQKLVSRRHASAYECAHHRTRIYHVHDKALYRAMGMPDHYHRRPVTLSRAIERLMLLDDALANAELTWLVTEAEKFAHFGHASSCSAADVWPRTIVRRGTAEISHYFPDKLPIGIAGDGRTVLVYLFTQSGDASLRRFLHRHAPLLRALPAWTLRILLPKELAEAADSCQTAVRKELASPLRPAVVDELRWYFGQVKAASAIGRRSMPHARFERAHRAFAAPRFGLLYRAWLHDGEFALEGSASNAIVDALGSGDGRLDCLVLKSSYGHLSNLAGTS